MGISVFVYYSLGMEKAMRIIYKDRDTHVEIYETWDACFPKLRLLCHLIYVFFLLLFKNLPKLTDKIQSTLPNEM